MADADDAEPFTASSKPPSWPLACAMRTSPTRALKTDIQKLLDPPPCRRCRQG
jgi:hypothetical protein